MASESSSNTNNQGLSSEEIPSKSSSIGKELARRAILKSHLRRNGKRKIPGNSNSVKSLPSRLSKVSLGDQDSA